MTITEFVTRLAQVKKENRFEAIRTFLDRSKFYAVRHKTDFNRVEFCKAVLDECIAQKVEVSIYTQMGVGELGYKEIAFIKE